MIANENGVYFWADENSRHVVVVVAHLCEYIKNHLVVNFKWVNTMICKL